MKWFTWLWNMIFPAKIPSGVIVDLWVGERKTNWKVSSIHALDKGYALLACYDNSTRNDSWLLLIDSNGRATVKLKTEAETFGYGDRIGDWIYIPSEDKDGRIVRVNVKTLNIEQLPFKQPFQYGARQVDGMCSYIARGSRNNTLYDMTTGKLTNITFSHSDDIISGMCKRDDEWIVCGLSGGIQSSKGWYIQDGCPEIINLNGSILAFLRNGDVRILDGNKLGSKIASTGCKPCRAVKVGRLVYWITWNTDQLWVTNGKKSKKLYDFGNPRIDPMSNGSLFGTSISESNGNIIVARSRGTNGYDVYRIKVK